MNKQEYLNQISAKTTPTKSKVPAFLGSKFFWIVIGCIVFMILILVVGSVATSGRVSVEDRVVELILHVDNTKSTVETYQPNLKSGLLRSYTANLLSILGDTSNKLSAYATTAYEYDPEKVDEKLLKETTEAADELNNELFLAKINGYLDNAFDAKMVYEIETIMTQEDAILKETSKEELKNILTTSRNSLSSLYTNFDEFEVGM